MFENYRTIEGKTVRRVKTSAYIWVGIACLALGIYLIFQNIFIGALFLVLFAFPFFMLYPLIRFLFGGEDSIGAVVVTAVVEELLKSEIKKAARGKKRR